MSKFIEMIDFAGDPAFVAVRHITSVQIGGGSGSNYAASVCVHTTGGERIEQMYTTKAAALAAQEEILRELEAV